jgi:hypothetical protein
MSSQPQTDWSIVGPFLAAAIAFGLVYGLSLANGAPVELIVLRSTGALLIVGLACVSISRILQRVTHLEEPATRGTAVDVTLADTAPDATQAPAHPTDRPSQAA